MPIALGVDCYFFQKKIGSQATRPTAKASTPFRPRWLIQHTRPVYFHIAVFPYCYHLSKKKLPHLPNKTAFPPLPALTMKGRCEVVALGRFVATSCGTCFSTKL